MPRQFPVGYKSPNRLEAASDTISYQERSKTLSGLSRDMEKPARCWETGLLILIASVADPTLLHGNCQIHIWVNRTGDVVCPWVRKCDCFRLAWVDRKARIGECLWRIGVGNTLAIVASADDVQATSI